jgi:peroxiredoxin
VTNHLEVDWTKIPAPQDDGGADHLSGMSLPSLGLVATNGELVDLARLPGRSVVYAYPMTGRPDTPLPDGWDLIPGARGCTPQSCSFRDHASELAGFGVDNLFGLSTQATDYQREAAVRLHLPFPLLSDADLSLTTALELPILQVEQMTLIKRLTMIIDDGVISKVFYPVFPPDQNVEIVIDWLKQTS